MKANDETAAKKASTSERKKKETGHFQIVKLEERIAPNKGGFPGHSHSPHCNTYR
jgi:hypothetical protein